MERKSVKEIVELITSTYTLNTRSVKTGTWLGREQTICVYNSPEGRHCAFAMLAKDPSKLEEEVNADMLIHTHGMDILKEEFQGHQPEFYLWLQRLHDKDAFWDETGLTKSGRDYADDIIKTYTKTEFHGEGNIISE